MIIPTIGDIITLFNIKSVQTDDNYTLIGYIISVLITGNLTHNHYSYATTNKR